MKKIFFALLFTTLACTILLAADEPTKKQCQNREVTAISDIRANPDKFIGKWVFVKGEYEGWDKNRRLSEGPPVTRSDWVIYDLTAAIYVSANVESKDFQAAMMKIEGVGQKLSLCAIVDKNEKGQVYLKPAEGAWIEVEPLVIEQKPDKPPAKRG